MNRYEFRKEIRAAKKAAGVRPKKRYSTQIPFFIVLGTLIFSTVRNAAMLYQRTSAIDRQNAQAREPLEKIGGQTSFLDSLKVDLQKQAISDPVALRIVSDFYPSPAAAPKPEAKPGAASVPASTEPVPPGRRLN